ncbi:MAG: ECF-type sigma factor [Planctomycetota bacterium]
MSDLSGDEITKLLHRLRDGDAAAGEQLLPLLYADLHARAERMMRNEHRAVTLQPTALLHEAWLRLSQNPGAWTDRGHFVRLAARVMRNVLVDHARRRRAAGDVETNTLPVAIGPDAADHVDVLDLQAALQRLAECDPELEHIVELRFFGGLTLQETADSLGRPTSSVHRAWELARAFLLRELRRQGS